MASDVADRRQAVIWDMDGVLVDTTELHFNAWSQVCAEQGIPFDRRAFDAIFGMNNALTLATLMAETPNPEWIAETSDRKERLFRAAIRGNAETLPGVRRWLASLEAAGYAQAIASSAPQPNIDALVDELDLRSQFDVIVSGEDLPGKPDPAVFVEAARQLKIAPRRCVVVEDAPVGVAGARRAGMWCVAVATTRPAETLADADLVVANLDALPADAFRRLLAA